MFEKVIHAIPHNRDDHCDENRDIEQYRDVVHVLLSLQYKKNTMSFYIDRHNANEGILLAMASEYREEKEETVALTISKREVCVVRFGDGVFETLVASLNPAYERFNTYVRPKRDT